MKKSVLAIALAVLMAVSLLTVGAMAEGTALPNADANGVITLTEDVTLSDVKKFTEDTILDLAGHTLTLPRIDAENGASVVIRDSSSSKTGRITSASSVAAAVRANSSMTLESGTIECTYTDAKNNGIAIFNMGTFTMSGGTVKGVTGIYNTAWNGATEVKGKIVCNIEGGTVDAGIWGVCVMGRGIKNGDLSTVDNSGVVLNFSAGTIKTGEGGQGICGNASSGTRAGFTVNMIGGDIICNDACGMYLPSIGVTNISGGTITAAQCIRICSGELNVTGGTITCNEVSDGTDLIAGGSGGTLGAIVVGKAGNGYVGDIEVNVGGSAVIENTASGIENDVYPTIVVSDKNMAQTSEQKYNDPATGDPIEAVFKYSETSTVVNISAEVNGDIVKISNLTSTSTQDGGNTALNLDGATVDGNVINQTSAGGVFINNSQVTGTVSAGTGNSVTVIGSSVGAISEGNVVVVDSTVDGTPTTNPGTAVASVNGVTYDSLTEALAVAKAGNTVYLLNDVEIDAALAIPAGVTLDGNDFTIEASEAFSGSYLINLNNGDLSNVKIMDVVLDGNNKASILLKVGDGAVCSGLTVSGVTFKNATHGVYLGNDSGSQNAANNISFTDCTFEDLSYAGIYAQRGNIAVDQCKFQNIKSASSTAAGVLFDTGYFDDRAYSLSVTNSTFTNITGTSSNEKATGGVSITGTGTVSKLTVTGNTFSGNTIDIRLGKTTAPVITDANIAGNGIVNVVAAPGVGLYTAKFYSNNALVATVVSDETGKITIPAAPSNSGYIFLGWRSGDATYKAGEVVTITADTTFVAVWGNLPDVKPSEPETPETPVFPFYDVTARDWYYSAVKYVYEKGLMDGVDVGVFAPNDTLTRAMVWTIIARAEGVDTTGGATWYAKAQEWVTAKGISDGENPNAAITRQELVTMLYRLAGEPAVSGTITAPDAASVSTWATDAMTWAMNIGLVEGDENGAVTPTATATRAQAAALIMRYLEA